MTLLQTSKHTIWRCSFIVMVFIGLHVFLTFYQSKITSNHYSFLTRSWGFNHIKFYSIASIITFYAIVLSLTIPFFNHKLFQFLELISVHIKKIRKVKKIAFIALGVLAAGVFYVFKTKYFLLGDYNLRVNQTMKQDFLVTEYLTMKLLYYIATFLNKFNISPTQSFILVSCISGGIFISINCFIANLLGKTRLQKLLLIIGSTSSGMLLIFCGYLDIYALPLAFTSIYLYTALLYIRNKSYFWLAVIGLLISIGGHLLCVAFAPSLCIAWYHHNKKKLPFIATMQNKTRLYVIIAFALLGIIIAYNLKTGFILPLKAPPANLKYLTLFSFAHIWEFINGQLLGCGVSFIIVFYLVFKIIKDKPLINSETYFFITASAGMILTVFLANLHRGSGDWDILSFTAITLNSLVILLLINMQHTNLNLANYLLIIVIGFNSLNAFLWIDINSSNKSIPKIENMLINDPAPYYTAKLPGIIQLIYIYKENNLMQDAERISLKACDMLSYTDFRGCLMYANMLILQKKDSQAASFYEGLLQRNQNVPEAYAYLIYNYQTYKKNEKILPLISRFYEAFKIQPNLFLSHLDVTECLSMIQFLYNYNLSNNQTANLQEMGSIITQLKQLQQQRPARK